MSWTYDADVDALYVRVGDAPIVRQRELAPTVIVDENEAGGLVGVEVLSAAVDSWDPEVVLSRYVVSEFTRSLLRHLATEPMLRPRWSMSGGTYVTAMVSVSPSDVQGAVKSGQTMHDAVPA